MEAGEENRDLTPAALAGELTPEEMGHLTSLLQKPESLGMADKSLPDYIEIVHEEADKRTGDGDADPLLAAMDKYKDKKGYGGKQNDK